MGNPISEITIKGFKSIRSLKDFELRNLNILIGSNGAGKSNFIEFFQLLRAMTENNLSVYIKKQGGCDGYLFNGPKYTIRIETELRFKKQFTYSCAFLPTANEEFILEKEEFGAHQFFGGSESNLIGAKDNKASIEYEDDKQLYQLLSKLTVYHFHDTTSTSPMRRSEIIADKEQLRPNAANIASFLLGLRRNQPKAYGRIIQTIQLAAPFFDDFILKPAWKGEREDVNLSWKQKGSDYPMQPYHLSDGTLRFICLVTVLLQSELPSMILLDEPELGLHPHALALLAGLIKKASTQTQVIVSTQSATLIDHFEAQDIIVVNREDGESKFKRLDAESLKVWLEDYTLGELWQKNIFEDSPTHE